MKTILCSIYALSPVILFISGRMLLRYLKTRDKRRP
jgi:hypothetical protein